MIEERFLEYVPIVNIFFIYALIKNISFEFLNHSILCGLVTFVD